MIPSLLVSVAFAEPVRLGVVISSDDGRSGETELLYADSDNDRVRDVLVELGGFDPADVWQVTDATVDGVTSALSKAVLRASALSGEGRDVALLVYYTGHAGVDGLHLGDEVLPLASLKTAARVVPAQQRVFVVDACQAGQLLRSKGATLVSVSDAPSDFAPPPDEAWIASSGPEERSFEVDRRRGALFTHFFVSGARGAADLDGDGEVTLDELYGFVHARTAETAAGLGYVQQPRWAGELGPFVLSRLDRAPAGIEAGGPVPRPLLVVSEREETVVAELPAGAGGRLALPPGRYQLVGLGGGTERVEVASVEVPSQGYAPVRTGDLELRRGVRTKGGLIDTHPFGVALGYALATGQTPGRIDGHGGWVQARSTLGRGHDLWLGAQLVSLPFRTPTVQGVDTSATGWLGWRSDLLPGPLRLGPGADLGGGWLRQRASRAPDPMWGSWYGDATAETVSDVPVLRAHGGVGLDVPAGALAMVGWVGLGPSVAWSTPAHPALDLVIRLGVEVTP